MPELSGSWEFWIDRGGTFTDCIGRAPDGSLHSTKLLSSTSAPADAIRRILERAGELSPATSAVVLPPCSVKLGSTVATNALLERRGIPTALVANRGLADVFLIGTQERPELFGLEIRKPVPLHAHTVEVAGRVAFDGDVIEPFDEASAREGLARAHAAGARSVAVALIHAYAFPEHERRLLALAREVGFEYVVASHEIARELGLLARGETTAADAYLTPLLRAHVDDLERALPDSRLRFMQSSGGLTDAARFRGPNALLSGPSGGVVAAARVARSAGFERAIGFDMGGTSTDVSLIAGAELERVFETVVGGVRVKAPMLRIHTVAAGGGSLCRFDGFRLTVGPESAGAEPGPLCYGRRSEAGELLAEELALSDANFALGRIAPDRFPFSLEAFGVEAELERLRGVLAVAGFDRSHDEIAAGFVEIANASMAQAIAQVSVARGVDPRDCVLVGFGGAGGQHVCAIARELGIRQILLHPLAGLLSAYGIGVAEVSWDGQGDAGRLPLVARDVAIDPVVERTLAELEDQGRAALGAEGIPSRQVTLERWLDLRTLGTDTALSIAEPRRSSGAARAGPNEWALAFHREHEQRFGYTRRERPVEIVTARVRARAPGAPQEESSSPLPESRPSARLLRTDRVWFPGVGRVSTPVYEREGLLPGCEIEGPAVVLEDSGTVVLDPGFRGRVAGDGVLSLFDDVDEVDGAERPPVSEPVSLAVADPVRLEVFANRFMSIAEQMGAVLRNTAISTNIKERLDYSCAVFDDGGGLVANAPHIPVHLGAMGETVRAVLARFADLEPGDVLVSNDPFEGGSHLPDVTAVTPVFLDGARGDSAARPSFFVASRGHHADLGGSTPGSMPPDSRSLVEEGVVIHAFRLVRRGVFAEERLREILANARHPARRPDDNVADLVGMVAANRAGERLLQGLCAEQEAQIVSATMRQLQSAAADKVADEIERLPDGEHRFQDQLDDGTPVCVSLRVAGREMDIDFEGTGPASAGNLNAPRAVVQAAVIYVLRSLVAERIPLNGGCLAPVSIRIPAGSLLDPPEGAAVVGGNVETSQRLVDVLLGALGLAAASQGTMNNVTFGDESFGYYETIGGGAGAGPGFAGADGVHTHMTNTRITDAEVLESRYPVELREFSLRRGSGGRGRSRGGEGLVRRYRFTAPVTVSILSERRECDPFGLAGGEPGARGRNRLERSDGELIPLAGKCSVRLDPGEGLRIETPGGGGYGKSGD